MDRPKILNKAQDEFLQESGFVILQNFIPQEIIEKHLELCKSLMKTSSSEDPVFWNSLWNLPKFKAKELNEILKEDLTPILQKHLENFSVPQITFMVKLAGENTFSSPHRDFSILNENKQQYWNAWAPLVEINEENGPLFVVPNTHKEYGEPRPFFENWKFENLNENFQEIKQLVYPKRGDLVLYLERMTHGSIANKTQEIRPNLHFGILPQNPNYVFYKRENNGLIFLDVDESFYLEKKFLNKEYLDNLLEKKL